MSRKLLLILCIIFLAMSNAYAANEENKIDNQDKKVHPTDATQSAIVLPKITVFGLVDQDPAVPVITKFGTQFNVITEEQIKRQNSLDFYDALRNVPGVMYRKRNVIGGQTGHSLYIRGHGASHPSPDLSIQFDGVPRSGVLYGQTLADGIPVFALGGMEVFKSPQPTQFGSGYGMINFIPKYMTEEGTEIRIGFEGGSFGTFAENIGLGAKYGNWDIYGAQSWISTVGHDDHTAAHQASYYLNLGYQFTDNWDVRLLANKVEAGTQAPNNPWNEALYQGGIDHFTTNVSFLTLTLNNDYDVAHGYLKAYYNHTFFNLHDESNSSGTIANYATSRQTNVLYGLRGREILNLWKGSEIIIGADYDITELWNDQKVHSTGAKTSWEFPIHSMFTPYIGISQTFGDDDSFHITPSVGYRYYLSNVFDNHGSPQGGLVIGYGNTNLAFNYVHGINYPSPVIFQGFLRNTSKELDKISTKDIEPEIVDHFELSLSHVQPDLFSLSATVFHDSGRNRTRANMGAMGVVPTNFSTSWFNSTTSEYTIEGLELAGKVIPFDGFELFAGATWLKVRAEGKGSQGTPYARQLVSDHKMPYTPSFALQAGFNWNIWGGLVLSADYQHLSGVYDSTYGRGGPGGVNTNDGMVIMNDKNRLPDINVFNARLDYNFTYDDLYVKEGKVFVAVNNIFNTPYAYALELNSSNTDRKLYYMPGTSFMAGFELKF